MVGRFDRLWTRDGRLLRLPQEDCCQALSVPPTRKYEPDGGPGIRQIFDMSAQLNVDAGEIRHNRMKLAMAVGDRRRYVIDQIMPPVECGYPDQPRSGNSGRNRKREAMHPADQFEAFKKLAAGAGRQ